MIFGFNLCTMFLLVIWITYFRMELRDLEGRKPLEDGKI